LASFKPTVNGTPDGGVHGWGVALGYLAAIEYLKVSPVARYAENARSKWRHIRAE
jgi:hypothetical protein